MKRYTLMVCLAIAIGIVSSCNKFDCDPPKKYWQLRQMDRVSSKVRFDYDQQRSLTHITKVPWSFGPNFLIKSDAAGRPLIVRDSVSTSYDSLVYQNGKLVRVDMKNAAGTVTEKITFVYDNKGRLVQRNGRANSYAIAIYTYQGNSRNVSRVSYFNAPVVSGKSALDTAGLGRPAMYIDYTYDSQINPFSTFLHTDVVPFWMPEYWGGTTYDPISPNNPLSLDFYGRTGTGYFRFQRHEFSFTYEYEYPVTLSFTNISYNLDGTPGFGSTYQGGYTYYKYN